MLLADLIKLLCETSSLLIFQLSIPVIRNRVRTAFTPYVSYSFIFFAILSFSPSRFEGEFGLDLTCYPYVHVMKTCYTFDEYIA